MRSTMPGDNCMVYDTSSPTITPSRECFRLTNMPTREDAIRVVREALDVGVSAISRFPTGLSHYVYDVVTNDGRRIVVRMVSGDTRAALAGGIYWHEQLRAV